MNNYGGYSTTSYGAQGGQDGGGFVQGGSQSGSQTAGKGFADETLRPVTIKQVIDAEVPYPDAPFRIDGIEVTQVTFVGQVRAVTPQTTNITYRIDDGTGIIEVKQWVDADKQDEGVKPGIQLDAYVRVWGRLKSFNNKRHVSAHVIKPVTDFNEVNYHLLEATYVHLFFTRGAPGGAGGATGGEDDSMFVDGGAYGGGADSGNMNGTKLSRVGPKARKMFNWLNNAPGGNEGVHLNMIAQGSNMSVQDVLGAADELLAEGLVYTTIDDETWAILDY